MRPASNRIYQRIDRRFVNQNSNIKSDSNMTEPVIKSKKYATRAQILSRDAKRPSIQNQSPINSA